jgi:hypothetical protein
VRFEFVYRVFLNYIWVFINEKHPNELIEEEDEEDNDANEQFLMPLLERIGSFTKK